MNVRTLSDFSLQTYRSQLADLRLGKRVGPWLYFHESMICELPDEVIAFIGEAEKVAGSAVHFNVVKISVLQPIVSLLSYPGFFSQGFPLLHTAVRYDKTAGEFRTRDYSAVASKPVLHRKELLLPPDHERIEEFNALTEAAEHEGLFEAPRLIGTSQAWNELLKQTGLVVSGHRLLRADGSEVIPSPDNPRVRRHKTALARSRLSVPMQLAARYGFFDRCQSVFDYGCGRGDDLRVLSGMGLDARGWDPHFNPEADKVSADLVNLGFVLNVIESPQERSRVLRDAFSLAKQALVVGVLAGSPRADANFRSYRDGFLTSRGTFQRYFTQPELLAFLGEVLPGRVHSLGTGVAVAFKCEAAEAEFLAFKAISRDRPERSVKRPEVDLSSDQVKRVSGRFWMRCLELGRVPHRDELEDAGEVVSLFGSPANALELIKPIFDEAELKEAAKRRREQLLVDFALARFDKQEAFKWLPASIKRDVRSFFGTISSLKETAGKLLFSIADQKVLLEACMDASDEGWGFLSGCHNLQLHASLVDRLPPVLRVYAGCAERLLGSFDGIDLLKIHINSGKVSTLTFDDFDGEPVPRLRERIKINLWKGSIEYFDYIGPFEPKPLYLKSLYMTEEMDGYEAQESFDRQLLKLGVIGNDQKPPKWGQLQERLDEIGWMIIDFDLLPTLDARCGEHFTYRQLIECGDTFAKGGIANLPESAESYRALDDLVRTVLDPVVEEFGGLELTYGFAGPELTRGIKKDIAPRKDQHAAHELNSKGNPICNRGGAACDFRVKGMDSWDLAKWVAENTGFDRLYFYGSDRPVHVSVGPDESRSVTIMRRPDGTRGPWKTMKAVSFLSFSRSD